MENNKCNSAKRSTLSQDQKSSSEENQKLEVQSDHSNTKRDRGRDVACNGDTASFNKRSDESLDKKNSKIEHPFFETLPQTSTFSSYNYNSIVDNSRHTMSVMPYNMIAPVNGQWAGNSFENMPINQHNVTVNQSGMSIPGGLDIQASTPNMNSYAFMGMPASGDNAMYFGMGNYCQYGSMPVQENMFFLPPVKEILKLDNGVLYPPNPNAPPPTTRERPFGCKTVFVGGLPEKITEEIIREIFERCGAVETVRMSKKNFCHIRFSDEVYVDNALYFSGFRLKIENKDEAPFTGRLHVDYAQARDDQYDYECQQRALQRQARHQDQDYYRPPTPPVVHYTDHEASLICEKLKNEETFAQASSILISWLEKGECTKKNASSFFSMIQSTHNHVRKLQVDKGKYEDQLVEAKKMLKNQLEGIIRQFTEIEKIYKAASLQKCWDQFTKAQRKNIEMWKKQTVELKNAHVEEVINEREDEEMELSEDENPDKINTDNEQMKKQYDEDIHKNKEEVDSLRCRLQATRNEIIDMQADHKEELKQKDNQIATLRQALQNSKTEELNSSQRRLQDEDELKELRAFKRRMTEENPDCESVPAYENNSNSATLSNANIQREARFIGLISTFLHVHPFGANIDYICSYLHQIDATIRSRDVENLLQRYPMNFREDSTGVGATLGKKWHFTGF